VEPIIISNAFTHSDTNSQMMASIETAAPVESLQLADEVSGNRSSAAEESQGSRTRPRNARLFEFFYAALFLVVPLFFGGVIEPVYLLCWSGVFATALFLSFSRLSDLNQRLERRSDDMGHTVSWLLWSMPLYAIAQYLALRYRSYEHPILGTASAQLDTVQFLSAWLDLAAFAALFFVTRMYLQSVKYGERFLTGLLVVSGTVISFIALSHWFYDTGKLFWTFSPEAVFTSERARWPFVNANHLGDYLLPILLLTVAQFSHLVSKLFQREVARGRRRNRTLIALVGSDDFHKKIVYPLLFVIPTLTISLAILASQSRGAWIGGAIALLIFIFGTKQRAGETPPITAPAIPLQDIRKRSRHRGRSAEALRMDGSWALRLVKTFPNFLRPIAVGSIALLLLFFLNAKGRELIAGRIEYGLLYSLEDIRWSFYQHSWAMFLDNPLWGSGLGSWFSWFGKYASAELAGLNAVYLHSDPYQFLIEMGLIGCIPWLCIFFILMRGYKQVRAKSEIKGRHTNLTALLAGAIGLLVASLPEFPFRIPVIQMLGCVMLALLVHRLDKLLSDPGEEG
jgi:O-antigen ligase